MWPAGRSLPIPAIVQLKYVQILTHFCVFIKKKNFVILINKTNKNKAFYSKAF